MARKKNRPSPRDPFATEDVPQMAEFYSRKGPEYFAVPKDVRDSVITRAANIKGHDEMTRKAMADIKQRKLKADAEAPDAGLYAKARAKFNELTGYAKGGKVSTASKRADGIAQKGKTRGKVC